MPATIRMAQKVGPRLGKRPLLQRCLPPQEVSQQLMTTLLIIHFAVTWALVGLIWTIQVVHYPLFKDVGRENFIAYHERHMSLITWVVGPLMLVEVASAAGLLYLGERSVLFCISLVTLVLIWVSTWALSVPLHHKLARGYDARTIQRLVYTNLWRSLGWTIRGLCLSSLLRLHIS